MKAGRIMRFPSARLEAFGEECPVGTGPSPGRVESA